jgi:acetyl esterase
MSGMDEATRAVMTAMSAVFPAVETMDAVAARAAVAAMPRPAVAPPAVGHVEDTMITAPTADVAVRIYRPGADPSPLPVIIYFHGGGFVLGSLDSYDIAMRVACREARAIVVAVDYRLAPEHPFPGAVEDADAALVWVADRARELGGDPRSLAVAGDSAGGNLAAVAATRAAARGTPAVKSQLLIYPMLDPRRSGPSHREHATGCFLTEAAVAWFWRQYLPPGTDLGDPRVAPVFAPALGAAPPAVIVVAGCDPLRDDALAYAAALERAGVPVDLRRHDDSFHGFFGAAASLPAAAHVRDETWRSFGDALLTR